MPSSTSSSSTPPGRCGASPSGVPGWVCPARPWAPPWPLWWAACWLWPSCCCGKAPSASGSPLPGRSPVPACGTCCGSAVLWRENVPPSLWRRWWWCASWPAWVPWPLPPTAWLSMPRACATWRATASRAQLSPSSARPWVPTGRIWPSVLPGCAPALAWESWPFPALACGSLPLP